MNNVKLMCNCATKLDKTEGKQGHPYTYTHFCI